MFDNCYELYSAVCAPAAARTSVSTPAVAMRAPALVMVSVNKVNQASKGSHGWGWTRAPDPYDPGGDAPCNILNFKAHMR